MMLTLPWGVRGNFAGRCASCWERTASDWHTASMSPGDTEPGEKDGVSIKINWFSHEVWIFCMCFWSENKRSPTLNTDQKQRQYHKLRPKDLFIAVCTILKLLEASST